MAGKKATKEKAVYKIGGKEVTEIKNINFEMIQKHIMQLGKEDIQWLIDTMETEVETRDKKTDEVVIGEDGKPLMHKPTSLEVRSAFVHKYFPEMLKGGPKKSGTMEKALAELKAALESK